MKKILYILIISSLFVVSCTNNDTENVFKDSPEARIAKFESMCKTTLEQGNGTWITHYNGEVISLEFKNGYVTSHSTFNEQLDDIKTTYRIGTSHTTEIVFENYSIFSAIYDKHRLENPEFEFLFKKVSDKTITLESKTDWGAGVGIPKTDLVLEKLTNINYVKEYNDFKTKITNLPYYKDIYVDGKDINARLIILNNSVILKRVTPKGVVNKISSMDLNLSDSTLTFNPSLKIGDFELKTCKYNVKGNIFTAQQGSKKIEIRISDKANNNDFIKNYWHQLFTDDAIIKGMIKDITGYSHGMYKVYQNVKKDFLAYNAIYKVTNLQLYLDYGFILSKFVDSPMLGVMGIRFKDWNTDPNTLHGVQMYKSLAMYGGDRADVKSCFQKNKDGGIYLTNFVLDSKGLHIDYLGVDINGRCMYGLISNSNPKDYIIITDAYTIF